MVYALDTHGWDSFYNSWVKPFEQIVVPTAIILVAYFATSGLLTRFMVRTQSRTWHPLPHHFWAVIGCSALIGAAAFLPVVSQTHAFAGRGRMAWWGLWITVGVGVVLVLCASVLGQFIQGRGWKEGGRRAVMPHWTAVVLLALWAVLIRSAFVWHHDRPFYTYAAVVLVGLTATATALGQNLRIQIDAQGTNGQRDTTTSDYVLARLPMVSAGPVDFPGLAGASPIGTLITSDQLSAISAGGLVAAVARLMYTIMPGLTWRAQLTLVDPDRVVVSLTRNGRLAGSTVVSRVDLGLPPFKGELKSPELEAALGRARAEALTGASAFILVALSLRHPKLQKGLCGATVWKSVALKAIAKEPALVTDPKLKIKLLRDAVARDPDNAPVRINYLFELYNRAPATVDTMLRFARLMSDEVQRCADKRDGWEDIRMAAQHYATTFRVNACLIARATGQPLGDEPEVLNAAKESVRDVLELTRQPDRPESAAAMRPWAIGLWNTIFCLSGRAGTVSAQRGLCPYAIPNTTPDLALFNAGLTILAKSSGVDHDLHDPDDDLAFGAATIKGPDVLRGDPSFWHVLQNPAEAARLDAAIGVGSLGMLDLAPFQEHRAKLTAVSVTSFTDLRRLWGSGAEQQKALTEQLGVNPLVAGSLAGIAELAGLHHDLGSAEVVQVFLDAGVSSVEQLRSAVADDFTALTARLAVHAEIRGLTTALAFQHPGRWRAALKRRPQPVRPPAPTPSPKLTLTNTHPLAGSTPPHRPARHPAPTPPAKP